MILATPGSLDVRAILVVGMPGSGKSIFSEAAKNCGIPTVVMGDVIRREIRSLGLEVNRENMLKISRELRSRYGKDIVAKRTLEAIADLDSKWVIVDGVRSLEEVKLFKNSLAEIYIVAIHSSPRTRFRRLLERSRSGDPQNWRDFVERDMLELSYGLGSVIALADYMIVNEDIDLDTFRNLCLSTLKKITGARC